MWTQRWGGRHSAWMKSVPTWVRTVRGEVPGSSEVGIRVYSDQRRVWWGKWLSYLLPRMKRWIAASFHLCYLTETGGLQTQEGSFIYTEQPCWLQHSHFITCFSLYCDFGVNPNAYCWCQQYFNPILKKFYFMNLQLINERKGFRLCVAMHWFKGGPTLSNNPPVIERSRPMWATNWDWKSVEQSKTTDLFHKSHPSYSREMFKCGSWKCGVLEEETVWHFEKYVYLLWRRWSQQPVSLA